MFGHTMKLGQAMRGLLPKALKDKVPAKQEAGTWPTRTHARKVLMLAGCVQPSMMPNINSATARVLDLAGIQTVIAPNAGCCGAVSFHLNDQERGKAQMRANIDTWWPLVERNEVEAIIMNASGCGVTVREYGHILRHDPSYALKARRISELTRDLGELLPELVQTLKTRVKAPGGVVAYHPPCTLQHGQKLRNGVEVNLRALGFDLQVSQSESHLCCGSAGTYSVLQAKLAYSLRDRKLCHLQQLQPNVIVSANIGCITHLQSGSVIPVQHWIELLDAAIVATDSEQ